MHHIEEQKLLYAKELNNILIAEKEKTIAYIYRNVLCYDNEALFLKKMNHVFNQLPNKLKEIYPAVKYKDIVWCCLFLLKTPLEDMAVVLNMKKESVRKIRQRLRKELDVSDTKQFEDFLHTFD